MKSALAVLAVLVLAGCESPADANWSFSGRVSGLDEAPAEPQATRAAVPAPGVISVTGLVTTPCWNDAVTLDGNRSGNRLTVVVESVPQQPCTDQRVRTHSILAVFGTLNRATFTVTMINRIGNPAGVVMIEETVRIE